MNRMKKKVGQGRDIDVYKQMYICLVIYYVRVFHFLIKGFVQASFCFVRGKEILTGSPFFTNYG